MGDRDKNETTTEDIQEEFESILSELSASADRMTAMRAKKGGHAVQALVDLQTLVKFRDLATAIRGVDSYALGQ